MSRLVSGWVHRSAPRRSAPGSADRRSPRGRTGRRHPIGIATLLALGLGLTCAAGDASAHARSVSYSSWSRTPTGARVQARISLLELSRLGIALPGLSDAAGEPGAEDAIGAYLAAHLQLLANGVPCPPEQPPSPRSAEPGWVTYRWTVDCGTADATEIRTAILLDRAPSHLHFARLIARGDDGGDGRIVERVLTESEPAWTLPAADPGAGPAEPVPAATALRDYVALGVEHILSGWDHLAFVLALVLIARSLGEVARLVTGFTLAHSITLALATLRWVEPRSAPVEAVIGFSVALIAAENAWLLGGRGIAVPGVLIAGLLGLTALAATGLGELPAIALAGLTVFTASHFGLLRVARDPGRLRVVLAFAFGLVHGFGFAGVLAEMALPTDRLVSALLGFNVGVELGQLAVVAALWPILVLLRRSFDGRPYRVFADVAGAAVCGVGLYWFVTRTLGAGA